MKTRFRKVFCDRRKSGKTGKIPGERECFGNGHETDWADMKKTDGIIGRTNNF